MTIPAGTCTKKGAGLVLCVRQGTASGRMGQWLAVVSEGHTYKIVSHDDAVDLMRSAARAAVGGECRGMRR